MNTSLLYWIVWIVLFLLFTILAWTSGAKVKQSNYGTGTFGGWTVMWAIFVALSILVFTRIPAINTAIDKLIEKVGAAGQGAAQALAQPEDPTDPPTAYVQWDTAKAALQRKAGKNLPDGWRVAVTYPGGSPKLVVNPEPIPAGVIPSVYFDPDTSKLQGKSPTVPVPFPR